MSRINPIAAVEHPRQEVISGPPHGGELRKESSSYEVRQDFDLFPHTSRDFKETKECGEEEEEEAI